MTSRNLFAGAFASALAFAALLGGTTASQAGTINFDDIASFAPVPDGYAGLNWSAIWVHEADFAGYATGVVSSPHVAYVIPGGGSFSTPVGGSTFGLESLFVTAAWRDGMTVTITGYLGGLLKDTFSTTVDTSGPTLINLNWSDIDTVAFDASGGTIHPGFFPNEPATQIVLDDIVVTPLPAALPLFAGGAGVIGFFGWRRKKHAALGLWRCTS